MNKSSWEVSQPTDTGRFLSHTPQGATKLIILQHVAETADFFYKFSFISDELFCQYLVRHPMIRHFDNPDLARQARSKWDAHINICALIQGDRGKQLCYTLYVHRASKVVFLTTSIFFYTPHVAPDLMTFHTVVIKYSPRPTWCRCIHTAVAGSNALAKDISLWAEWKC